MIFCLHELYLAPFARYSAYKISVSDLELSGSPKVKSCNFKKAHMRLYNGILLTSGVTTPGQLWSMTRLPFGLTRLPCPRI